MSEHISTFHTPNSNGQIEIKRAVKHYMPSGYEYIIVFQETLERVLTYSLNSTELKVFIYVLSQVGFENSLIMPGLQNRCAKSIGDYQPNVSKALKKLENFNIIIKEPIEHTKSFLFRINYELVAKDKGSEIKEKHAKDKKNNPIQSDLLNLFN